MKSTIERLREWNRTIRASGLSDLLEEAASKLEEMEQLREQDGQQMSALIAGYQRIQRDCIDGTESRAGTDDWKTVSVTSQPGDQESKSPERVQLSDAGPRLKMMNDRLEELRTAADQADDEYRAEIACLRLTAAEREAVEGMAAYFDTRGNITLQAWGSLLRVLLMRLGGGR